MIEHARGLTDTALEAIAGLERRTVAADGGRLKLEWSVLRERPRDQVRDLLWWESERLLGFLGIYGFNWPWLEITGMVDPDARRRGIGRALVEAALPLCREHGRERLLMVVPRTSPGGRGLAEDLGMTHDHSEHALTLDRRPARSGPDDASLSLRQATVDDIPVLSALFREGFGDDGHVDPDRLATARSRTLMIVRGDEPLGTIAVARDGDRGAVYAFVVRPDLRGRGIGRQVLRRVCDELLDAGAARVHLEVEVDNDRALGLYTAVGFRAVATDDYYALTLR